MSNLYIRLKTGFFNHVKTLRLRARIGDDAFWIPPRLWAYAAENKPDGDFSSYSSEELASLIGCPKYATSIRQALLDVCFLDADGKLHDWQEHNGYHEKFSHRARLAALAMHEKRRSNKEKKQKKEDIEKEIGKGKGEASIAASMPQALLVAEPPKNGTLTAEVLKARLHRLFGRRDTTQWNEGEVKMLKRVSTHGTTEADLLLVEEFQKDPTSFHRRDLLTLLNNWNTEIDRARQWKLNPQNGHPRPPEPNQMQETIQIKRL